jgi:hypothetical protein
MGMVYGLATLKVPHMQEKFERLGWQLIGIIPGFDRELVEPGVVKRVYEAIYTKVLVDEEDFVRPRYTDMTTRDGRTLRTPLPWQSECGVAVPSSDPLRPAARWDPLVR